MRRFEMMEGVGEEKVEDVGVDGGRFSLASGVAERWIVSRQKREL
jgi:hypothetical protein